jgi:hypothetical protein
VRSKAVRAGWYRAAVVAALFALLSGCTRPQGTLALPSASESPSSVAAHEPLTITDVAMHDGEVGLAFAPITLAAAGGVAPYHWTVSVGSLPDGLTLSPQGVVSGAPTSNGTFHFGIQVFDSDSDTAGLPRTIGIVPRLTAALLPACATECSVELGCVTVCGTFGQVSGGASPLTYKLTSGPLPSGTSLSGMALKGTFTGLPGRLSFTVQVTDGFGVARSLTPTFNLIPHISLGNGTCYGNFGSGCSGQMQITGGGPGPSVTLVAFNQNTTPNPPPFAGGCWYPAMTTPPAGYGLSAGGGYVTATIPKGDISGYGALWSVVVTDQYLCAAGVYCSSAPATMRIGVQCG